MFVNTNTAIRCLFMLVHSYKYNLWF